MKKYFVGVIFLILWLWLSFETAQNVYWYKMNPIAAFYMSIVNVTHWSKEFNEKAFASITIGDKSDTVYKTLGPPLKKELLHADFTSEIKEITNTYYLKGDTIWYYSLGADGIGTSSSDGCIHINFVVFDENMKVRKKIKSFNID
jgi:hypothetical protein